VQTLKAVSFTARQGEVTALVGPSGGGKSTVAKLSARFWDIDKGKITLGGEDISKIDPETLLKHFSIVFQDVTLFNSSVMENIRLGKKDAADEEVMEAARLAQCDEFVQKLPQGYETLIGENGEKLSGGERQRISIARAILKDAPIILLDEATASLDAENESKIQSALSELIRNKTVLIIAHRMRTVSGADKIIGSRTAPLRKWVAFGAAGETGYLLIHAEGTIPNELKPSTTGTAWGRPIKSIQGVDKIDTLKKTL
jgi:ATP-binding cassette subfamily B protein